MKKYFNILVGPLLILFLFFLVGFVWKLFNFPPQEELIPLVKNYFDTYGMWLVFISAIIESGFVIGVYAPGGLIIFLGVIFSIGDPAKAIWIVLSVIIGFVIGFTSDFFLGKYGWYKFLLHFGFDKALSKMKEKIEKYRISTAWVSYNDPNLGSLFATTCGILQYSYKKFLFITVPAVIVWCTFWGTIAYVFGDGALKLLGYKVIYIILGVWIIARFVELKLEEKKNKS